MKISNKQEAKLLAVDLERALNLTTRDGLYNFLNERLVFSKQHPMCRKLTFFGKTECRYCVFNAGDPMPKDYACLDLAYWGMFLGVHQNRPIEQIKDNIAKYLRRINASIETINS